jgi:hypothetical protein
MMSSYPLFMCNTYVKLTIVNCQFVMGQDVSNINGILVSRATNLQCNFTLCTFKHMYVLRTTMFYDGGYTRIDFGFCIFENITSTSVRGGLYYTLNVTLMHSAYFNNTEVEDFHANLCTHGGLIYFVCGSSNSEHMLTNCTVSRISVRVDSNSSGSGGGALHYASPLSRLLISNTTFQFIRRPYAGGAVYISSRANISNKNVFNGSLFNSLEGSIGGAIYAGVNVYLFLYFLFRIFYFVGFIRFLSICKQQCFATAWRGK